MTYLLKMDRYYKNIISGTDCNDLFGSAKSIQDE